MIKLFVLMFCSGGAPPLQEVWACLIGRGHSATTPRFQEPFDLSIAAVSDRNEAWSVAAADPTVLHHIPSGQRGDRSQFMLW